MAEVSYANPISRWLLASSFRDQWVILEPPWAIEAFLAWHERHLLRVDAGSIAIDRPIFIVSLPRCGSSMLQDVLCTHPRLGFFSNTMHAFRHCFCSAEHFRRRARLDVRGERFLGDSVVVEAGSPADPVGVWSEWLKLDPYSLDCPELNAASFTAVEIERIRDGIRRVLWCFGGAATRFECKTPALLPYVSLLQELFPEARFIHLVRDARMGANSMVKLNRICQEQLASLRARSRRLRRDRRAFTAYPRLPGLPGLVREFGADDIRTTAHLWDESIRHLNRLRGTLAHLYEVRYEDILADPAAEIPRIFEFCGLPPIEEGNAAYREKLAGVGRIHHSNAYGSFGVVEEICRDSMRQYGYL